MIAEYEVTQDHPSSTPDVLDHLKTHHWGHDLSNTPQGAGGVGGLLATSIKQSNGSWKNYLPSYDGNGNIIAWSSETGGVLQRIDYDPFGNTLTKNGSFPDEEKLTFGFSTKYEDNETGLLYYGYRYYDPVTGRWPSRDPIGERGGINLYGIIGNNAINDVDYLGLISSVHAAVPRLAASGMTAEEIAALLGVSIAVVAPLMPDPVIDPPTPPRPRPTPKPPKPSPEPKPKPKPEPKPPTTTGPTIPVPPPGLKHPKCCSERNPTWPKCKGPSDPEAAVRQFASGLPAGLFVDLNSRGGQTAVLKTRPANPDACPQGGTWHSVFVSTALAGDIMDGGSRNVSVLCCNCCRGTNPTDVESKSCRVIHPQRGAGNSPGVPGF